MWLAQTALDLMTFEAGRASPAETGGVLIGYWGVSPPCVVVTEAIAAGEHAVEALETFTPDYYHDKRAIDDRYHRSAGRQTYLGDWHSHPDGAAYLSNLDRRALRRIGRSRRARTPRPVMAILSSGEPWELKAWVWEKKRGLRGWWRSEADELAVKVY